MAREFGKLGEGAVDCAILVVTSLATVPLGDSQRSISG